MEEEKNERLKYWQDKDGSVGFIRVMSATLIFSGLAMIWFQLIAVPLSPEFSLVDVEWMGPSGIIGMGLTGKVSQKYTESR